MISLHAVLDLPKSVQQHLYFLRFEDLMAQPAASMSHVYSWLGLSPLQIDPERIAVGAGESDSHYHMKYSHQRSSRIEPPRRHEIPPRIQAQIESVWSWFYQLYYPAEAPARKRT
jgi:sulfotransferase